MSHQHDPAPRPRPTPQQWRYAQIDFRAPLVALALATGLAGVADAFAFLKYRVFLGIQTGNVDFVGMGLAGKLDAWPCAVASLILFGLGGLLGAGIRRLPNIGPLGPPAIELLTMMVLIAVWGVVDIALDSGRDSLSERVLLTALGAFPIGILGGMVVRTFNYQTSTTFQTGTVLRTTHGLFDWIFERGPARDTAGKLASLGVLCLGCYAIGGFVGAKATGSPVWVFIIAEALIVPMVLLTRPDPGVPATSA